MSEPKRHNKKVAVSSTSAVKTHKATAEPDTRPSHAPANRWRVFGKKLWSFILSSSLPEVMLIATLCFSRYLQNSDFSYPSEVILNIVLLSILVSLEYGVLRLILRKPLPA